MDACLGRAEMERSAAAQRAAAAGASSADLPRKRLRGYETDWRGPTGLRKNKNLKDNFQHEEQHYQQYSTIGAALVAAAAAGEAGDAAAATRGVEQARQLAADGESMCEKRSKQLQMALHGGWETVHMYDQPGFVDGPEDAVRYERAVRAAKTLAKSAQRSTGRPASRSGGRMRGNAWPVQAAAAVLPQQFLPALPKLASQQAGMRGARGPSGLPVCYACGVEGHMRANCPGLNLARRP